MSVVYYCSLKVLVQVLYPFLYLIKSYTKAKFIRCVRSHVST